MDVNNAKKRVKIIYYVNNNTINARTNFVEMM